jgi:GMP synthase (glutamine-hydrolysing)
MSAADEQLVDHDTVLVVDFGAQYAQLIARRVRELRVYSEIVPRTITAREIAKRRPKGIIFSGGPASVHVEGAPSIDSEVYELQIPILGICYGAQLIAQQLSGGEVRRTGGGEYGPTELRVVGAGSTLLFRELPDRQQVWMSHSDSIVAAPDGFVTTAETKGTPVAAFEDTERRIFGTQFHPEVAHTKRGMEVLDAFLRACDCRRSWTHLSIIEEAVRKIQQQVGNERVLCALSGGVDSAVAAALVHRAVGDRLTCVFVDTGLLREGEPEQVRETFENQFKMDLVHRPEAERFLKELAPVTDPEEKRKVIGTEFIRVFEEVARAHDDAKFLVQGTLYPDVVESGGAENAVIKSHHNVGGLPEDMDFDLVEPLRRLFKDEVRAIGVELGLPEKIVQRQPFPGPGLAVRIVGSVNEERLRIVRAADVIINEELQHHGEYDNLWQSFAVLLADVRSVGVKGDARSYEHPIIVRAVESDDAMTADWARLSHDVMARISARIVNEVPGVNRVVYDMTPKPPGTIEWE